METIVSGGMSFEAVWLRCSVQGSFKPDELLVFLDPLDAVEPASYFVHPDLVLLERSPGPDETVEGNVKVILLETRDDAVIVEVPGEPVSYGPKITVAPSLVLS